MKQTKQKKTGLPPKNEEVKMQAGKQATEQPTSQPTSQQSTSQQTHLPTNQSTKAGKQQFVNPVFSRSVRNTCSYVRTRLKHTLLCFLRQLETRIRTHVHLKHPLPYFLRQLETSVRTYVPIKHTLPYFSVS